MVFVTYGSELNVQISVSETVLEDEKSIPILLRWYKRTFFEHETYRSKGNCCILAVITLETLLESNVDLVIYSGDLFSQCVLPLHEMITCHQCGEQSDPSNINNEIIISWYKIHCKLSENVQHVKYVKKYGKLNASVSEGVMKIEVRIKTHICRHI